MAKANPPVEDPLNDSRTNAGAASGAILLSDQIHYYIKNLDPPLLHNPEEKPINPEELEKCLDAASYKLRLGDEAHVGGEWKRVSANEPLVIPPHQVAIVKTYEEINLPRFLIARWNLRVKWVYEGLLWTGGPQVDPGWQGNLYCPIYNLAERQIVIPYKERVFTMDFALTTQVPNDTKTCETTHGYTKNGYTKDGNKVSVHKAQRGKSIQSHDVNRLRSAPFEQLRLLANLDGRVNAFSIFTYLVLAVLVAAIGVVAVLGGKPVADSESDSMQAAASGGTSLVLAIIALAFGFAGLMIGSVSLSARHDRVPKGRVRISLLSIAGAIFLGLGSGFIGSWVTSGLPTWPLPLVLLAAVGSISGVIIGIAILWLLWHRASELPVWRWL